MLVKNIRITNFMSVTELVIDFSQNIYTVITGDNASGKSALLEAISMALTDRRKGDSYRDYVRLGTKKATIEMEVNLENQPLSIEVEINNRKYGNPVNRSINYKGQIFKNSDCGLLLKSLNVKYLQHITFFHQKDSSVLNLKPKEVASLLKDIFNINYSAEVGGILPQIDEMKESSYSMQAELKAKEQFLRTLNIVELLDPPSRTEGELNAEIAEVRNTLESFKSIKEHSDKQAELKEKILKIENKVSELSNKRAQIQQSIKEDEEKILAKSKELAEKEECLKEKPPHSSKDLLDISSALENYLKDLQELRDTLPELNSQKSNIEKKLEAHKAGKCYVCASDLTDKSFKINVFEKEINDIESKFLEIGEARDSLIVELNGIKELKEETEAKIRSHESKIHKSQLEIPSLKSTISTFSDNIKYKKRQIEDILAESVENLMLKEELEESLVPVPDDKKTFLQELKIKLNKLTSELEEVKRISIVNTERLDNNKKVEERRSELNAEIDVLKTKINVTERKIEHYEISTRVLTDDFPNYVILQKTKDLEASMNLIVRKIFPDMKVKLTPKRSGISFFYSPEADIDWLPTKMASGAQAAILMLAWRVSLAEMYGITTLCLDEIDADATDENSALIYEFLGSLEAFDQIILISHRKSAIKLIRDTNESVKSFWVKDGIYTEKDSILD